MSWLPWLPTLNATLNLLSLLLLCAGYAAIRRGRRNLHRNLMISAFIVSTVFLASYVTYRCLGTEKKFGGQGWIRPVYFTILISHVTLAATIPFLATTTLVLALRGRIERHRRLARWTLPIWLYVSVTGVLVYIFLFRLYGRAG